MTEESPQSNSPPPRVRRSSFAGQTFADLFGTSRSSVSRPSNQTQNSPPQQQQQPVGPISEAAARAQGRRLSLTTLGLSGSPNGSSPFGSFRGHRDSFGSANSGSIDESAIAEDDGPAANGGGSGSTPSTPFARRMSFGAKAMKDMRAGSFSGQVDGGGGGVAGSPGAQNGTRSPPTTSTSKAQNGTISSRDAKGRGLSLTLPHSYYRPLTVNLSSEHELTVTFHLGPAGEGFNWSDNFRSRAQRTSIAGQGGLGALSGAGGAHSRAKSVATMEPPPAAPPKPKERARPDHFQERILKGDFYMD